MKPAYQEEYPHRGNRKKFGCCARCCFTDYEVSGSDYIACMVCERPLRAIENKAGIRFMKDRLQARARSAYLRRIFAQAQVCRSTR